MTEPRASDVLGWMLRKPHEFVFFIALVAALGAALAL